MKVYVLALAIFCFGCSLVRGQSTPADHKSASPPGDGAKPEVEEVKSGPQSGKNTLKLKDIPASDPEAAAGIAARELAKKHNSNEQPSAKGQDPAENGGAANDRTKRAPDDAVVEFHPDENASGSKPGASTVVHDKQDKSPLKRVHGDVYGAKSGFGHAEGGSVGASSKSGKTSIYVQSDQMRSNTSPPQ